MTGYSHDGFFGCNQTCPPRAAFPHSGTSGVKTPPGPFSEIIKAWHGQLAYDPATIRSPVAIIRGEWDGLLPDDDARWLFDAFTHAPSKRDIKIARGTHLMHLETMRPALWRESINFLHGDDIAAIPA